MKTTIFASKQALCDDNCALDVIIGKKKKEKEQGLDKEHKHKLKPVIKHFDIRILWNFKFSLAVVKRKDSEWVLILIIPRDVYDVHRKGTRNIQKYTVFFCCVISLY